MSAPQFITETYKGDLKVLQTIPTGNEVAALLFFHGGGWSAGSAEVFLPYFPYLPSVWVFTADYRVWSRHRSDVYDSIEDANCAAKFVLGRIGALPLFLAGASAGGTLALLASANNAAAGVICFNPVLDLSFSGFVNKRTPKGGDVTISPAHLLGKQQFPPILILQGEEDKTTPLRTAKEFAEAAARHGQPVELVSFPRRDHGFFNLGPPEREATAPLVQKFIQSCIGN